MRAPVPIYANPDWHEAPGAELASIGTQPDEDVDETFGLAFDHKTGKYVAPRADALRRQTLRVEDLDDEELMRGQVRDADGRFRSGPLRQIPREFHDELMRRIISIGTDRLRNAYLSAIDVITEDVIGDANVDIRLRYDAAKYVIERLAGKTPDRVEVGVELKRWETVMQSIIKEVPIDVIDAEVVDEDEPDEEG